MWMGITVVGMLLYTIALLTSVLVIADRVIERFLSDRVARHEKELNDIQDKIQKELVQHLKGVKPDSLDFSLKSTIPN